MALSFISKYSRINQFVLKSIRYSSSKVIALEIDANDVIDNFTSDLMQRKLTKWDHNKIKKKIAKAEKSDKRFNLINQKLLDVNINSINEDELEKTIIKIIDDGNIKDLQYIFEQCSQFQKCPKLSVILRVLSIFSQIGDIDTIYKIKELLKSSNSIVYKSNGEFDHYIAEAMWVKGNLNKSLELFDRVYRENIFLRRRVRLMIRYLIFDVTNKSEAVLVNIIKFSEQILQDFGDYFPLACVWQTCFLSEWYTDQQIALELLEHNDGLCKAVVNNIPYVVSVSLKSHQTDVVYRLLEILLKYNMNMQYSVVLIALFDYRFRQNDLRSCSEIMKWSVENKIMLPSTLHERFLLLLLNRPVVTKKPVVSPKKPKYNYKF